MKLIVITTPGFWEGEAEAIISLFSSGLEILHIRKPDSLVADFEDLLKKLPTEYLKRIVTHEHFCLATAYGLKGIHLNGRNPLLPDNYRGHISCSCHSLEEVAERKAASDYVFLSPIYDSISKVGYASAYSQKTLSDAQQAGIIDDKVMALGGINREHLPEVKALGFGGAVLLGDIWNQKDNDFIPYFLELKQLVGDSFGNL